MLMSSYAAVAATNKAALLIEHIMSHVLLPPQVVGQISMFSNRRHNDFNSIRIIRTLLSFLLPIDPEINTTSPQSRPTKGGLVQGWESVFLDNTSHLFNTYNK